MLKTVIIFFYSLTLLLFQICKIFIKAIVTIDFYFAMHKTKKCIDNYRNPKLTELAFDNDDYLFLADYLLLSWSTFTFK